MTKEDYPKKVTKGNIPQLIEKAKKIKKKDFWLMIGAVVLYGVLGILIMPILFYLVGWFLIISFPALPSETFPIFLFAVFTVVFFLTLYRLLELILWLFERYLRLPKSEEKVFARCFSIANA